MGTLYLCGAGNPEGVRLALTINRVQNRWNRIIILDDDSSKHGKSILDVEIAGPFSTLEQADTGEDEVSNLVARTTKGRQSALRKIQAYGISVTTLVAPDIDIFGVDMDSNITVYQHAVLCANSILGAGSVVFGGALVGHGVHLGPGSVVAPGAVINARVEIGEGVYIGSNASILPDLKIGSWATIGANSAVVQDVPAEATVMGVPAQLLMPLGGNQFEKIPKSSTLEQAEKGDSAKNSITLPGQTVIRSETLGRLRAAQEEFITSHTVKKH